MKLIRNEWPKVRVVQNRGNDYFEVDMRRKGYTGIQRPKYNDREKALQFAKDMAAKVKGDGVNSISTFQTPAHWTAFHEQCALFGKTVEQGFEAALTEFARLKSIDDSPYMGELVTVWKLDKIENTLKPMRPASKNGIRCYGKMIQEGFGKLRIKELTAEKINEWLNNAEGQNQHKRNMRSYLSQFCNWCIQKRHFTLNPCIYVKVHVQQNAPRYLTIEQCKELLVVTSREEYKHLLPYICLALFAGVRPKEAAYLKWEHIDLDNKYVTIPAEISKTKKVRGFNMSPPLHAWLTKCKDYPLLMPKLSASVTKKGNPPDLSKQIRKNLKFKWEQDILRHSFATYHYAEFASLESLRQIMGNSPDIIEKFYKSPAMKAFVVEFNGMLPDTIVSAQMEAIKK